MIRTLKHILTHNTEEFKVCANCRAINDCSRSVCCKCSKDDLRPTDSEELDEIVNEYIEEFDNVIMET